MNIIFKKQQQNTLLELAGSQVAFSYTRISASLSECVILWLEHHYLSIAFGQNWV